MPPKSKAFFNNTAKNLFFVHATSRSGHHAIVDWIYAQYLNEKAFFNHESYVNRKNFFASRSEYYYNDKKYFHKLNRNWEKYGVLEEKLKTFSPETKESLTSLINNDKNLLMMNFENLIVQWHMADYGDFKKQFSNFSNFRNILVIRDIFNYLASKMKMGRYFFPKTNLACWKAHAYEYLNQTNDLENKVCISYNRWCKDITYRQQIAFELKTDTKLDDWNKVSPIGGGSSFEGTRYNHQASQMKTDKRWVEFASNQEFRKHLKDGELIALSNAIFGPIEGTEIFLK